MLQRPFVTVFVLSVCQASLRLVLCFVSPHLTTSSQSLTLGKVCVHPAAQCCWQDGWCGSLLPLTPLSLNSSSVVLRKGTPLQCLHLLWGSWLMRSGILGSEINGSKGTGFGFHSGFLHAGAEAGRIYCSGKVLLFHFHGRANRPVLLSSL